MDAAPDVVFDGELPPTPIGVPLAPEPPNLLPCAGDFREVDRDGVAACDPWPETGRAECPPNEVHLPGTAGCAILGPACPAGLFPDDAPAGALFVDPGAAAPGDGSLATPFADLTDALAAAALLAEADGSATVQLAAAIFLDAVTLPADVTLRGACTAGTRFEGTTVTGAGAAVSADTGGGGLAQLTITGPRTALDVAGSASLVLTDLVVDEPGTPAVLLRERGTVRGDGLLLRAADLETEPGLRLEDAGQADLRDLSVEGFGVEVMGAGAVLQLRGAIVEGAAGTGLLVNAGASAALILTTLEGHGGSALLVRGESANARVTDSRIASSEYGVVSLDRATVSLERTELSHHEITAVQCEGTGAAAVLTDVLLTAPNGMACDGGCDIPPLGLSAMRAQDGGAIELSRIVIVAAAERAIDAVDDGKVDGANVRILDTLAGDGDGVSLVAGSNGDITLEGLSIASMVSAGAVLSLTPTSSLRLMHVSLDGGDAGPCLRVEDGSVDLTTVALVACGGAGIDAGDGRLSAQDLRVSGTLASATRPGAGLYAGPNANLDLERFALVGGEASGLHFAPPGATPGRRTLLLTDGFIGGSPVGVRLLDPAVDEVALREALTFEDVEVEVSTEP